jgi:hypothetical protein
MGMSGTNESADVQLKNKGVHFAQADELHLKIL